MGRSIQELSAEVATNPNSTAFVELAAAYRERGDLERAARLCLRGLERHPTHVEAHYELGRIYEARGERELALDEWSIVRQLAPDHLPAVCASIRLYMEEGRLSDAARDLGEARKLSPGDPAVRALARSYEAASARAGNGSESARVEARSRSAEAEAAPESAVTDEGGDAGASPGAMGVLMVDPHGRITAGGVKGGSSSEVKTLARSLSGARAEAERVASYLNIGEWSSMVVETKSARLSVSPVGEGVIIVATDPSLPAGQARRIVQRARKGAREKLEDDED